MRLVLFLTAIMSVTSASAQEYKKFKAGIAFGFVSRSAPGAASFDAAYRINDYMAVGFRNEVADIQANLIHSKSVYYQVYFRGFHNKFRPFASLGIGQFIPSTDMNGGCGVPHADRNIGIEKKIGLFTRVGFDLGHLTLTAETNLAAKSKSVVESSLQPTDAGYHDPYVQYLSNSYVTMKLGFFFWGGKKKPKL